MAELNRSSQLDDDLAIAQKEGLTFYLYVNKNTTFSEQLTEWILENKIVVVTFST